ncbi:MAG: acyltransferase family protein [Dehalococcoidia bacterium]
MDNDGAPPDRLPALDGLRALAVAAVMLFHYETRTYVPGGLFGVDVFFVLSGFLISSLLVREWLKGGAISLRGFYVRRVLRIAPAAGVFVLVYLAVVLAFSGQPLVFGLTSAQAWAQVAWFLSQLYSWGIALDQLPGSGFSHLWSLSTEEQFYLVWPLLLYGLLRRGVRLPVILLLAGSLVLLSAAVPVFLGLPQFYDVYFRADFRAHSLLAGSMAGMAYAAGYLRVEHVRGLPFRAGLGAAVVYLGYIFFGMSERQMWASYAWAMPLVSLAAAFVVVGAAFVRSGPGLALLANPVVSHIGRRSYALYLWHFPIGIALAGEGMVAQMALGLPLSLLAAEASFWLVERPALRFRRRLLRQALQSPSPIIVPPAVKPAGSLALETPAA